MILRQLIRIAAAGATSVGLASSGLAGIVSAEGYSHHGPINFGSGNTHTVTTAVVTNNNSQLSQSGNAVVIGKGGFWHWGNSSSGNKVTSGNASNTSAQTNTVTVSAPTMSGHGGQGGQGGQGGEVSEVNNILSNNTSTMTSAVVTNNSEQGAYSGNAVIKDSGNNNTATTGSATNTSTETSTVTVN